LNRYQADREVNNRTCTVIREKKLQTIKSYQVKVGDILKISEDEEIRADCVILIILKKGKKIK
jgi:P-type E1-E2 ATPase